jgi:protein TonB
VLGARPGFFSDPDNRFNIAFGVSIVLHLVLLSVHFRLPEKLLSKATEKPLEIVLVNAKSRNKPTEAQVLAQTHLDGGGNTDEDRRLRTPLPPSVNTKEGDAMVETRQRMQQLEKIQQALLTQAKSRAVIDTQQYRTPPVDTPPSATGFDLAQNALAIARLEGQIDKAIDEYNKRPRKKFIGARAEEYRFAQYIEDWRQKIERIGTLNYPEAARGKVYGSLLLSISVRADGSVDRLEVLRSSGYPVLDDAARRIVQMASPFAPFPQDIRRDTDVIEITRTWVFTNADRLKTE